MNYNPRKKPLNLPNRERHESIWINSEGARVHGRQRPLDLLVFDEIGFVRVRWRKDR